MTALSIVAALGAAVMFGWSTAAMHHGASGAEVHHSGWRGLLALLGHVVRQWRWLTGLIASFLGVVLHADALRMGSLTVVQPVIVSGLVFSFFFRSALDRELPSARTVLWSAVTTLGLALFLIVGHETAGDPKPDGAHAAAVLAGGVALAALCWWLSRRTRASMSGVLLGAGAGVIFGLTAGTLKATAAEGSVTQVLTGWPLYVLLALGAVGFLANQTAYRRPLASALPALNLMNPLVALAYGALAFSEKPPGHPAALAAGLCSLTVVLIGVAFLARGQSAGAPETERVTRDDDETEFAAAA
jgi:hypothetical protein